MEAVGRGAACGYGFPRSGNREAPRLPDLVYPKGGNRDSLAIQRHELDFVPPSFAMHEHDGADVSGRKLLLRQITREHDFVTFADYFHD